MQRDLARLPVVLRNGVEAAVAREIAAELDTTDVPIKAAVVAQLAKLMADLRRRAAQMQPAPAPQPVPTDEEHRDVTSLLDRLKRGSTPPAS